jgi:LPXTG-motif cell wall-anchored protein
LLNEEYVYIPEEPTPLAPMTPTPLARLDTTPKTDDPNHPWFWFGLCFASIFGIGLLRSRKKEDDK